jgi:hypothetical protein
MLALKGLGGLVVIDEIQRLPDLFPVLRVLADRARPATKFLVLGSASPDLLQQSCWSTWNRWDRPMSLELEVAAGDEPRGKGLRRTLALVSHRVA